MSVAAKSGAPLRLEPAESSRLAWSFALSLAVHLLAFATYRTGQKAGWWQAIPLADWMPSFKTLTQLLKQPDQNPPLALPQDPLMFLEVSPAQATAEPPKEAKYYSDKNAVAANPDADKDTAIPKITGEQTQVAKTEDVPREQLTPLQPAEPLPPPEEMMKPLPAEELKPKSAEEPKPKPIEEPKPKPVEDVKPKPVEEPKPKPPPEPTPPKPAPPGDLAMTKLEPTPPKPASAPVVERAKAADPAPRPRPRTIQEALARRGENRLPGEKMKQDGGVKRRAAVAALDTKATLFGSYDAALVEAISSRWFSLLEERVYASDSRGKVVLHFSLHYDGRVTDLSVVESTTGEVLSLICQKAVLDPAPFAAWPSDMRRLLGERRNIQFTFYYN